MLICFTRGILLKYIYLTLSRVILHIFSFLVYGSETPLGSRKLMIGHCPTILSGGTGVGRDSSHTPPIPLFYTSLVSDASTTSTTNTLRLQVRVSKGATRPIRHTYSPTTKLRTTSSSQLELIHCDALFS